MPTTLAFAPRPKDFDEDFFGIPVLSWRLQPESEDQPLTPPSLAPPSAAPVAAR